jgi:hypothetical protein
MSERIVTAEPVSVCPHPAILLIAARPDLFARQGRVAKTWRHERGRRFGPYYRLVYREEGGRRSLYLGGDGPVVEQVRRELDCLQLPWRARRERQQLSDHAAAALRAQKTALHAALRAVGLRLQGYEVRGWRTSLMRGINPRLDL